MQAHGQSQGPLIQQFCNYCSLKSGDHGMDLEFFPPTLSFMPAGGMTGFQGMGKGMLK